MSERSPVCLPTHRSNRFDPPDDLAWYREHEPIRRLSYPDGHLGWLVTGYPLVRQALADRRFSSRSELVRVPVRRDGAGPFIGRPAQPGWFVDMDQPDHTRFRRLLGGHFTAARMDELRPRIAEMTQQALDAVERKGPPVDLVRDFAQPVPALVMQELLGVPASERAAYQQHSTTLFSLEASAEEGAAAMKALGDLLHGLIRHKRRRPAGDLLGALARGGGLSDEELAGTGVLLLTAGLDSVANMLALGTLALLCHPDQAALLKAGTCPIEDMVEELLRYLTVFHLGVPRTPLEDVELGGQLIKAGECVTLSLSAANRDPGQFSMADELDPVRGAARHLAFGHGIHHCLGQHLARVEMQVGYSALFGRFPTLRLAVPVEEVPMSPGSGRYGVGRLAVTW